jgi:S-(hydroxymethyl)glutathione dehydrogenase/alcohol dehydrogenase
MGATHTLISGDIDPETALREMVPGGVDFAIDCTGRPDVMATCLSSVHAQGGTAVVVGNARYGEQLVIDPHQLNQGKRLFGTWGGDSVPPRDYAYYAELIASGEIDLSPLVSKEYRLDEINEAIADLAAARVMRPVINMEAR